MSWKQIYRNPNVHYDDKKRVQHYEHKEAIHNSRFYSTFTFEQVQHLAQLAYQDAVPDGTYSDDECSMWSMLRREFHQYD